MDAAKLREAIQVIRLGKAHFTHIDLGSISGHVNLVLAAAEAHLTGLLKTKEVDVWRVEYAQSGLPYSAAFHYRADADSYAGIVSRWLDTACIRVTGPHKQTVPE